MGASAGRSQVRSMLILPAAVSSSRHMQHTYTQTRTRTHWTRARAHLPLRVLRALRALSSQCPLLPLCQLLQPKALCRAHVVCVAGHFGVLVRDVGFGCKCRTCAGLGEACTLMLLP